MDRVGEGESRTNWGIRTDVYTLPCVKWMARNKSVQHRELSSVLCDKTLQQPPLDCNTIGIFARCHFHSSLFAMAAASPKLVIKYLLFFFPFCVSLFNHLFVLYLLSPSVFQDLGWEIHGNMAGSVQFSSVQSLIRVRLFATP